MRHSLSSLVGPIDVGTVIMKTRVHPLQVLRTGTVSMLRSGLDYQTQACTVVVTVYYIYMYVFSTLLWAIFTRSYVHGQTRRESKTSCDGCKVFKNFVQS